jgi:hypothetical protein
MEGLIAVQAQHVARRALMTLKRRLAQAASLIHEPQPAQPETGPTS